jgi:hypothetical protein
MYRASFTNTGAPIILNNDELDDEETSKIDFFSQAHERCQELNKALEDAKKRQIEALLPILNACGGLPYDNRRGLVKIQELGELSEIKLNKDI